MRRALTLITKRGMAATKTHYDRVAASYHDAYFYSDAYEMWQRDEVLRRLQLQPHHRVADIGGGTGRFVGLLKDAAGLATTPTCVDPSGAMLARATKATSDLRYVQSDARSYVDGLPPKALDRVLLKEVVHHFADDELASICAGLHKSLDRNGRVVVCTRPRDDVEYPFFEAARKVWRAAQPSADHFVAAFRRAGFECAVDVAAYPAVIDREVWLGMMRNRFWSTFAGFSDGELEAGVAEVAAAHPPGPIAFEERVVFIVADVK